MQKVLPALAVALGIVAASLVPETATAFTTFTTWTSPGQIYTMPSSIADCSTCDMTKTGLLTCDPPAKNCETTTGWFTIGGKQYNGKYYPGVH